MRKDDGNLNIETKSKPSGDNVFHPKPKEFATIIAAKLESRQEVPRSDLYNKVTIRGFDYENTA